MPPDGEFVTIDDDDEARRRLRWMGRLEEELARLKRQRDGEIADARSWFDDAVSGTMSQIQRIRDGLTSYARALDDDGRLTVGRRKSRQYPTGTIGKRKAADQVMFVAVRGDEDPEGTFCRWAIANDRWDLVNVTPSTSGIKAAIRIPDGKEGVPLDERDGSGTTLVLSTLDGVLMVQPENVPTPALTYAVVWAHEAVPALRYTVGADEYYARPVKHDLEEASGDER